MKMTAAIARGGAVTILAAGAAQFFRFTANVALAHLLAPDLFGLMAIVNAIRAGITLVTDIGVSQSIIVNQNAEEPEFYNTAWTINLIRNLLLSIVCALLAVPLAHFYGVDSLIVILPTSGLLFVLAGFTSLAPLLLQKRLKFTRINLFEMGVEFVGFSAPVVLALISPTIWALVVGNLIGSFGRLVASYLIIPGFRHRFRVSKRHTGQILNLGRWIFLGAIAYFFSTNIDRLYLAKFIPLDLLGIYSVARSLSEPAAQLVNRLTRVILFPAVASTADGPRSELRRHLASIRLLFLAAVATAMSMIAAGSDLLVHTIYDSRYHAAGWMLPFLLLSVWFSILSDVNESTLMGLAKPWYGAIANSAKLVWLLIGLPVGFAVLGFHGVIIVVSLSDLWRYVPILAGQVKSRVSFAMQDVALTVMLVLLVAAWEYIRWSLGLGITPLMPMPT